ncbi:hypothetical protein PROFUN_06025 [Planoprotostelium fungivorum]|uniref:Uncharacterized protein n=1 Tax=Planoprotostelium fungivorum TaxID=1890364 RepID=A0A2P6NPM4_9EUKA|nr:hypothetical protein PROFUN_06025 [Planoprotostelium fungivorum]
MSSERTTFFPQVAAYVTPGRNISEHDKVLVGQSGRSENMDKELKGFLNRQIVYNPDLQYFPVDEMKSLDIRSKVIMSTNSSLNLLTDTRFE